MSKRSISKSEALDLITPVIDGEVSPEKEEAFFAYIDTDPEVRRQFESEKKIKELMATRCPCCDAPEGLRDKIRTLIENECREKCEAETDSLHIDRPSRIAAEEPGEESGNRRPVLAAAASLLLLLAVWGFWSFSGGESSVDYNVEEYVYRHFADNNGRHLTPTINTASISGAELSLSDSYDMPMKVPLLDGTKFAGVVFSEFVPGFRTPMFEYYQPSARQYIYVFAFDIDSLDRYKKLKRTRSAVEKCQSQKDYYVIDFNGKHVVTWKWENTWYAAVSNHNGNTLASLVSPLQ